ncbi:hypothetical protein [Halomarina oriensis]|uniref:Uncharacterized protein n=1 Tax=Halomarina oriensis TaxID=671145 RepID=A0A6B0GNT1_9EURY|nr:hypothetical protein [Halomarina oriensis]MWG36340.1 hypothetical protein [Halomarina oriensis]
MSEKSAERTHSGSDESVRSRAGDRLDSMTGMDRPGRTREKTDRVMRYGKYALVSLGVAILFTFFGGVLGLIPFVGGLLAGITGLVSGVAWLAFLVFAVLFAYPLVKAMLS